MLWANKHRPQTFSDMVGDAKDLEYLTLSGSDNPMQHLLLYSAGAGTGKTTLAYVLANTLDYPIHVFNASSKKTRGIAFVEQELIPLTRAGNFKQIILLDEADQLTAEAQSALKGVIENAQGFFILTCNDISKVSPWIRSRCLEQHFSPISADDMMGRLTYICGAEGVSITESQLGVICKAHAGDLRNAINALQAYAVIPDPIEKNRFILSLTSAGLNVESFITTCIKEKDFMASYTMLKKESSNLRKVIRSIFDLALDGASLNTQTKLLVVDSAITAERDIIDGVDEDIVRSNFVRMLMQ